MTDKLDVEAHSCCKVNCPKIQELVDALAAKDAQATALQETIVKVNEGYVEASRRAAAKDAEIKGLRAEVNRASDALVDLGHKWDAAESRAASLEKERDESRAMYVKDVSEAQKQIAALQAQLAQAEAKLKTMSEGFDVACQDRDDLRAVLTVGEDDLRYIAEQCEAVGRVDGVSLQESRTWKVVGRLARQAGKKLEAALRQSVPASHEAGAICRGYEPGQEHLPDCTERPAASHEAGEAKS